MRDCLLTVTGDKGTTVTDRRVVIPPLPERPALEQIWRDHLEGAPHRYAVAREDRFIRAIYLAEDLVPEKAVRPTGRKGRAARWITTSVRLGDSPADRVFMGPDLFFRQVDLARPDAWLAPLLMRVGMDVDVHATWFGTDRLFDWEIRGERYYYWSGRGRWTLYGGGNTTQERVDRVIAEDSPRAVSSLLWSVGAVPLIGRYPPPRQGEANPA